MSASWNCFCEALSDAYLSGGGSSAAADYSTLKNGRHRLGGQYREESLAGNDRRRDAKNPLGINACSHTPEPAPETESGFVFKFDNPKVFARYDSQTHLMCSAITDLREMDPLEHPESNLDIDTVLTSPSRLKEFDAYWQASRASVRAFLTSLLYNKSDVDDCVQEVALIAWKKGPLAHGQQAFLGHCLASARLIGLAASRKQSQSRVQFLPPDVALSLADEVAQQELNETSPNLRILALRACLARLDEPQRRLLAVRYAAEGSTRIDELARGQGKSPDAFYKKLERLRSKVRECVSRRMRENTELS